LTDEQTLVQQLQAGDETAFRQLIAAYEERVLNTCLGFVPNLQDAEDLAQDVFVDVFRSIRSFRGDSGLSTWIYRIATNRCLGYLRQQKRGRSRRCKCRIFTTPAWRWKMQSGRPYCTGQ
jgi:RNA polymerase sigma-70 factor (ECF subfamily)